MIGPTESVLKVKSGSFKVKFSSCWIMYGMFGVQFRLATGPGGLKPIWILAPSSLEPLQRGIGFRAVTDGIRA